MMDVRDLAVPVIGAPMAGGPSTAALAAAVSDAGGLGFLAAGYKNPEAVATEVATVRATSTAPFGVNLFVVDPFQPDTAKIDAYRHTLEPEAARFDIELGEARWDDDYWQAKLDLVLDLRPDVVSFTFGCPSADVLRQVAASGMLSMVTVTSVDEARVAVDRGAASLAIQGPGAGGHQGTWDLEAPPNTTPLLDLVRSVLAKADVPVAAGGGVHDAAGVQSLRDAGVAAAQIGTAYLLAEEAGTNPTHRAALDDSAFTETAVTRAYTGRWARGLGNRFMARHTDAPAGYPHLHHVTAPLRRAAAATGDTDVAHMWAGTGHVHTQASTAAEITLSLAL